MLFFPHSLFPLTPWLVQTPPSTLVSLTPLPKQLSVHRQVLSAAGAIVTSDEKETKKLVPLVKVGINQA